MQVTRKTIKRLIWLALVFLAVLFFFNLTVLVSRFNYQRGLNFLRDAHYDKALQFLNTSLSSLPFKSALCFILTDEQKIEAALGDVFFLKALQGDDLTVITDDYVEAAQHYSTAASLNEYDYVAAIGLARVTAALEFLYEVEYPNQENPYNAKAYFQKALTIRPNGVDLHFNYCRYLAKKNDIPALQEILSHLIYIYPQGYYRIRQEPYYTSLLDQYLKAGLEKAIDEGISLREAYAALATLERDSNDLQEAINHYTMLLSVMPEKNDDNNYFRYGQLLLLNGTRDDASTQFITALKMAKDRDTMIRQIYAVYSRQKEFVSFVEFAATAEKTVELSELVDICIGRALVSAGQEELGEARFLRVNNSRYQGESLYHLAKIYESQEQWSDMELAAQRATVVSPKNSNYYAIFAKALDRQGKHLQAEGAIDRAIEYSHEPNRWLYNQRGWIRWNQKKYSHSLYDWLKAIKLDPGRSRFYYQASLALQKINDKVGARRYAEKAVEKEPNNEHYLKQLQQCK